MEGYQIHPNTKVSASPFLFNDTRVSNFPVYFVQIKCSVYETVASCAYPLSEFFDAGLRLQLENITELSNVSQPRRRCCFGSNTWLSQTKPLRGEKHGKTETDGNSFNSYSHMDQQITANPAPRSVAIPAILRFHTSASLH